MKVLTILLLLCTMVSQAQKQHGKPSSFYVDIGADQSVGANQSTKIQGVKNTNYFLDYYKWERFQTPSARLRTTALYIFSSWLLGGLQTGVTVRFQPIHGVTRLSLAVPLQARAMAKVTSFKKKVIYLDIAAGANFQKRVPFYAYTERGGALLNSGLLLAIEKWSIRGGYEYQNDRSNHQISSNVSSSLEDENIVYHKHHNLLYFSIGRTIF